MRLSYFLYQVVSSLVPPFLICNLYLYLYPIVQQCSFPYATPAAPQPTACWIEGQKPNVTIKPSFKAPFRLLVLADPQIEGDTSLPNPNAPRFASLVGLGNRVASAGLVGAPQSIADAVKGLVLEDVPAQLNAYRKRLDLWGNDYYLAHVYWSARWWSRPTHTAVMGDLIGSQWIDDAEFKSRSDRYWNRVFKGMKKIPSSIMATGDLDETSEVFIKGRLDSLDDSAMSQWKKWLINIAGNHDIGYSGDLNEGRVERFEKTFGKVNWEARFQLTSENTTSVPTRGGRDTSPPKLRLVMLNSMNLDSPAWSQSLQEDTHKFLGKQMDRTNRQRKEDATILLTHIPLFKESGVCVDSPYYTYFPDYNGGGLMEQNHLTEGASESILDGLFGAGNEPDSNRHGIILNGHDHEGCDVYHYQLAEDQEPDLDPPSTIGNWTTSEYKPARRNIFGKEAHGIREITVRSMMGSYSGNAGFLSGWFDADLGHWRFDYQSCQLGIQHIWWAIHVFDLIFIILALAVIPCALLEERSDRLEAAKASTEKKNQ